MTLHTPLWMQPASGDPDIDYSQAELRNMIASMIWAILGRDDGVSDPLDYVVSQRAAGANFSVDVSAGSAFLTDDDVTHGGIYYCHSDAVENVATPSAPASGTQVHRLVLQVRNKGENGSYTTYDFVPLLLADTGSGTPAEPPSAITLALISISAGQASVLDANITDERVILPGGVAWTDVPITAAGWSGSYSYRKTSNERVEFVFNASFTDDGTNHLSSGLNIDAAMPDGIGNVTSTKKVLIAPTGSGFSLNSGRIPFLQIASGVLSIAEVTTSTSGDVVYISIDHEWTLLR